MTEHLDPHTGNQSSTARIDSPQTGHREQGSALIVVVAILSICGMLAGRAFASSMHSASAAGATNKEVDATAAADAGLNLAIQTIGTSAMAALPCGTNALSGTMGTAPATSSYAASVAYYSDYPPTGTAVPCPSILSGAVIPQAALVSSTGTTTAHYYGDRETEALVQLSAVPGGGYNDAIFANGSISLSNLTTINGEPGQGSNANLYSNQNLTCANNETVHGSVYVQGTFTSANRCSVDGTVYSTGDITFSNSGTVGGDLKSSQGNITLSNTNIVNGDAIAHGTVSLSEQASVLGSIVQDAVLPDPPLQPFPSFTYSPSAWEAAGYTNQITDDDCNKADPQNVYSDIASMDTATVPTVIDTSCALSWSNNTSVVLNSSLAVISTGGFSTVNRFTVSTTSASPVDLFLIVPSSVTCLGSTGQMSFSNNSSFDQPVDLFLYSPCAVSFSNNQGTFGQIYSGSNVTIANQFTMTYIPMAMPAISGVGNPLAFSTSIIYDRAVPPGT